MPIAKRSSVVPNRQPPALDRAFAAKLTLLGSCALFWLAPVEARAQLAQASPRRERALAAAALPNPPVGNWVPILLAACTIGAAGWIVALRRANRHQARKLAEQLEFTRTVIDTVPNRIFVKDRDGRYTLVNKARAEWNGQTVAEIEGRLESELNPHSEQVAAFQRDDREVMDTLREKFIAEEKMTGFRGETVWMQTIKRPLISPDGKARQVLGVSTDITERRRTELYLNSILQNLPVAVFLKEAQALRFVMWNKANEELCGLASAQIVGKCDHDFFPKEQADAFVAKDREALAGGKLVEVEEEILTRHKGARVLLTRKIPLLDETGNPLYLLGISEDVTERKRAEEELAFERNLLRSLMDSSADYIYFKDKASRFLRCSKLVARFGLSPQEMVGKSDFDLFTEAHARPAFEDEQAIIRTGQPIVGKVEREVTKDGQEHWALTSKWRLCNPDGEVVGTFGISKDITAMKQAEAKLEHVHQQLLETSRQAGMAEVATSVLHNVGNVLNSINVSVSLVSDHLKTSKIPNLGRISTLLREHSGDLGRFISEDPKGQLLPAYIGQLADHLAAEQASIVAEIEELRKNVDHIKDIVVMQQNYAKIAGVTEPVQPTDLVEDALRLNAGALARHDVEIIRDYAADLPQVLVEKHKVLQILVNLIRNAKYACEESVTGERRLTLRVQATADRRSVRIEVVDNGVGIPTENLTRVFNHGFTTRKEGHGFGLHSGALTARELGGSLTAHSDGPGKGATFTLEFPVQRSTQPLPDPHA
jgi:PAS domain S-box-containing protein